MATFVLFYYMCIKEKQIIVFGIWSIFDWMNAFEISVSDEKNFKKKHRNKMPYELTTHKGEGSY